jgi:hypothetical protein
MPVGGPVECNRIHQALLSSKRPALRLELPAVPAVRFPILCGSRNISVRSRMLCIAVKLAQAYD